MIRSSLLRGIHATGCRTTTFLGNAPALLGRFPRYFSDATTESPKPVPEQRVTFGGLGKEAFVLMLERGAPFIGYTMAAKLDDISYHQLTMVLPKNEKLIGNVRTPCYHGGVVATMIDHVAGFCAWAALTDPYLRVSTVNVSVDYLIPPPVEDLFFHARIEHLTNRLARVSCTVWDSQKKRKVAIGHGLFNIYKGKEDLSHLIAEAFQKHPSLSNPSKAPSQV